MSLTLSGVVRYLWKAPSVLNPFLFLADFVEKGLQ
jgi:hypothetical protein